MSGLGTDPEENYSRFIREIADAGEVWALRADDEGWVICDSNEFEETEVIPFWSSRDYAQALCTEEWAAYVPELIDLDEFIDQWLKGMDEDGVLVGPNWNSEMIGMEVEPVSVARELFDLE